MRTQLAMLLAVPLAFAAITGLAAPSYAEEPEGEEPQYLCYDVDATGAVNLHPNEICFPPNEADCVTTTNGVPTVQEVTIKACTPD